MSGVILIGRSRLCPPYVCCYVQGVHRLLFFLLAALICFTPNLAHTASLRERLTPEVLTQVFPGAERLGPEQGAPPSIVVHKGDQVIGYLFSTLDVVRAGGYSGVPFDVIAGVDLAGRITGAKVIHHVEPYVINDAIRQSQLDTFLARQAGAPLSADAPTVHPDFVVGATISARLMRGAVIDAARLVLRARVARPVAIQPTLDRTTFRRMTWEELVAEGAVVRRRVTAGEVAAALTRAGAADAGLDVPLGKADDLYVDLHTALLTPPAIGGNLLGLERFNEYMRRMPSASVIVVASSGPYDFLGEDYYQAAKGYRFDRIRVVQGSRTFTFVNDQAFYRFDTRGYEGIRALQYAAVFALPETFDPLQPWRVELLVHGRSRGSTVTLPFPLDYKTPAAHILMPELEATPVWIEAWRDARVSIAILAAALTVLTLIFVFQDRLTRSRRAHRLVRNGFLIFVLVWLGWSAGAQLSIVHVINYLLAPFRRFDASVYLAEPLIVIIAFYTLVSLVLIGRGVFCGWLCPFGALQDLLAQVARVLRLPQWMPSEALERRLRIGKYVAAAVVLGLAFVSLDLALGAAEVEPFKTAITAKFTGAAPYVLYAAALLAIGLFVERAYCRFLCPLGGVLAVLDRLHLLDRLKRRPECGNPCHLCERACPVKAIERSGKIVTAECFQCLDCQVEYYDEQRCPPLRQARRQREIADPAMQVAGHA